MVQLRFGVYGRGRCGVTCYEMQRKATPFSVLLF